MMRKGSTFRLDESVKLFEQLGWPQRYLFFGFALSCSCEVVVSSVSSNLVRKGI